MAFISRQGLSAAYNNVYFQKGQRSINESLERRKWFNFTGQTTIFLSHSHLDKDIINHAVVFLDNLNVDVYVDWMDENMPPITNGATAKKIKDKIKGCNKFILLASNNAIASKWCNWELGFGDSNKYIKHLAVLPVTENDGTWRGSEYLQIYPRIELEVKEELHQKTTYVFIKFPDGTKISFQQWMNL